MFAAYIYFAYREMRQEGFKLKEKLIESVEKHEKMSIKAIVTFIAGTIGIFVGAEPFINALEETSVEYAIPIAILAIIISPIAGEMPEKISLMILARKGAAGTSIAVANVLRSKILNSSLLFAVAIFGAMAYHGLTSEIPATNILWNQMVIVTAVTIIALIPMLRNKISLRTGVLLLALYILGISVQFFLPQS